MEWIPPFFLEFKYVFFFIGMIIFGETVLIPALYGTIFGFFDLWLILGIALFATLLSDSVWYAVGRLWGKERIYSSRLFRNRQRTFEQIERTFNKQSLKILFLSKFVYGTRIAVQLLAGIYRVRFGSYLAVNALGTASLLVVFTAITYLVKESANAVELFTRRFEIAILIFTVAVAALHLISRYVIQRIWFRQ